MRLVGIYDADGGLVGDLRYIAAKAFGRTSCALCDITHGRALRPKRSWSDVVCDLAVPFELVHRDDAGAVPPAVRAPLPAVLADDHGRWVRLLGPVELASCTGDADRFREALLRAAEAHGITIVGTSTGMSDTRSDEEPTPVPPPPADASPSSTGVVDGDAQELDEAPPSDQD